MKTKETDGTTQPIALYSKEFLDKIKQFKADMHKFYTDIGAEVTPPFDATGRKIIEKRPDGYDYIIEGYMRKRLDYHFPGWSWERPTGQLQFLGGEWVIGEGDLVIMDERLLAFGITPPLRRYHGTAAARIRYKSGNAHTIENIVDVDIDVASANSRALKRSINRLTNIGDDVYGKRVDEEGAGSLEEIIMATDEPSTAKSMFEKYVSGKKILISRVYEILGIKNLNEITDYQQAYQTLKEKLG